MYKFVALVLFVCVTNADVLSKGGNKRVSLKPLSVCCDIPEIGDANPLANCTDTKVNGLCNEVQCVFERSGFLIDEGTLNKDAYKSHLLKWSQDHQGFSAAVDKVISDCVDVEPRQHLDIPCKAYDVFACTGIAILKKCPDDAWKC